MTKKLIALSAVVGLMIGLSACSTSPSYQKEVLEGYFSAINEVNPDQVLNAQKFASPGSNADAYAIEQSANKQAQLDGGTLDQTGSEVVYEQDQVLLCTEGFDLPDVDREDYCAVYSDFVFEGEKLADFSAGGEPLEGRIALGDGTATPIGEVGTATYLASYITISGELAVILEVTANSGLLNLPYEATYLGTSGRQMVLSFMDGPNELAAGRTGNVAYYFTGASFGGTLELTFTDSDWNEIPITIATQ